MSSPLTPPGPTLAWRGEQFPKKPGMLKLVTLTVFWQLFVYFFGLFGVLFWDGSQGGDFEGLGGSWDGDFEGKGGIPQVEEGLLQPRLQSSLQNNRASQNW